MGILNILKASWTGKVGQTVGAKWKNKSTIRTYTRPSDPNTPAQQTVRNGFGEVSSFVALFADQIRTLSALNTKGMSVRNAIIQLNKEMVANGMLNESALLISRGGLPNATAVNAVIAGGRASINVTWTPATGATISDKSRLVFVAADNNLNYVATGSALNSTGTLTLATPVPNGANLHCYYYIVDYRGSSKVASPSAYRNIS